MIVYSILHKPSGKFMPQRMSRSEGQTRQVQ